MTQEVGLEHGWNNLFQIDNLVDIHTFLTPFKSLLIKGSL